MTQRCALLEAAVSCGSPTRGTEGAYDALVTAGLNALLGAEVCYPMEKLPPCSTYPLNLRHLDTVMAVSRALRTNMLDALESGLFPVVIGGDHSIAIGSLAALGEFYGAEQVAVVYIDAHADINTEQSTVTGYIHGMDLAAACGLCCGELTAGRKKVNVQGENVHIIGARSVDPAEWPILAAQGVHVHRADEVRERGVASVLAEVLPRLRGKKVHISFDVDSLEPAEFAATGYNIPGGLTLRQAEEILSAVMSTGNVCSFECVEYNPRLDPDGEDRKKLMALLNILNG